jgi:predicted kinase
MFAGPNGSGKSTLKTVLKPELLGVYLNPDDIESRIRGQKFLDVRDYGVITDEGIDAKILAFFRTSNLIETATLWSDQKA